MTSIINPNIRNLFNKKKQYKAFNATKIMRQTMSEGYEDDSDDSYEPEYMYYDAMGRPYLDTVVQRTTNLGDIIKKIQDDEDERDRNMYYFNELVFDSLDKPDESCPAVFTIDASSWVASMASYRSKMEQDKKDAELVEFNLQNDKKDAEFREKELDFIVSRLPKFSAIMLKRMADESAEIARIAAIPKASSKFYTDTNKSNESRSAVWGHRRNGGGNTKKTVLVALPGQLSAEAMSKIRDKKYKKLVELVALEAQKSRQLKRDNKKEKNYIEETKRLEKIKEINMRMSAKPVIKKDVVVVEETEFQIFQREQVENFVSRQKLMIPVVVNKAVRTFDELVIETTNNKLVKVEVKIKDGWNKVETKSTNKKKTTEDTLVRMFYDDKSRNPVRPPQVPFSMLCISVIDNVKCRHGKRCKFAHNPSQMNISPCGFGDRCRNTKLVSGKWVNGPGRTCMFSHPGEEVDKVALCLRMGMKKELIPIVVNKKCVVPHVDERVIPRVLNQTRVLNQPAWKVNPSRVFKVTKTTLNSVISEIVSLKITDVVLQFV